MAETDNMNLALPGSNEYVDVEVLNENFRKIDAAVLLALAAAAPYSAKTYALGAYCTRGGRLYRCTTAITAAEDWTEAHWTETTVTAELIAHATSKSNPHGVTAAQTGAYSKEESDTLLANKAEESAFSSHVSNKSNPHGVTAEQIGAVKTRGMIPDGTDFKTLVNQDGIYKLNSGYKYESIPDKVSGKWGFLIVDGAGALLHALNTDLVYYCANLYIPSWIRMANEYDLADRPKIAIGSYVGTGTYSSANPNSLTFDFEPKVVIVVADGSNGFCAGFLIVRGQTFSDGIGSFSAGSVALGLNITWSGNTVSWYTTNDFDAGKANAQMNTSGKTFRYVALG